MSILYIDTIYGQSEKFQKLGPQDSIQVVNLTDTRACNTQANFLRCPCVPTLHAAKKRDILQKEKLVRDYLFLQTFLSATA